MDNKVVRFAEWMSECCGRRTGDGVDVFSIRWERHEAASRL